MKSYKNIIGATAILATIAISGMTPENAGDKQKQIPFVELDYLLWQKPTPQSSSSDLQSLARAKEIARGINERFHNAKEAQEKRDIFHNFGKVVDSLDPYDAQLIEKCARYSKMRLKYGISDGAEPFYSNACQFPIRDELGERNLYSYFGRYQHQILKDRLSNKNKALK